VDVYYGYNHSNETYTLPDNMRYFYYASYFGAVIDTMYYTNEYMDDTIVTLIREDLFY